MTTTTIPNGIYFLHPDGSAWLAARYRGRLIDWTEEACAETHAAARDSWAGIVPSDEDEEIDPDVAMAIIREVMGADTCAEGVLVTQSV